RSGSPDVVKFGRHLYSDKPPVLAALAAPIYGIARMMGLRFSGPPPQFVLVNLVLTWLLVGLGSGLALVALRPPLEAAPVVPWLADLLTLAFGFSSPLWVYGVTFNNPALWSRPYESVKLSPDTELPILRGGGSDDPQRCLRAVLSGCPLVRYGSGGHG